MNLDTCYAAKGGSNTAGPTKGANEVSAATNEVIDAPGVSGLSFTPVLVRVLKGFADEHRTENLQLSVMLKHRKTAKVFQLLFRLQEFSSKIA